jgi:PTS system mannose-specific IIA component
MRPDAQRPIGILVAAHGEVGPVLLRAAEGIVGSMGAIEAVTFGYGEALSDARDRIAEAVCRLELGRGVLILTDMFGGTPTNVSLAFLERGRVEVLAGVNLPILLKANAARAEMELGELALFLRDYGARNIVLASEIWGSRPPRCG